MKRKGYSRSHSALMFQRDIHCFRETEATVSLTERERETEVVNVVNLVLKLLLRFLSKTHRNARDYGIFFFFL